MLVVLQQEADHKQAQLVAQHQVLLLHYKVVLVVVVLSVLVLSAVLVVMHRMVAKVLIPHTTVMLAMQDCILVAVVLVAGLWSTLELLESPERAVAAVLVDRPREPASWPPRRALRPLAASVGQRPTTPAVAAVEAQQGQRLELAVPGLLVTA